MHKKNIITLISTTALLIICGYVFLGNRKKISPTLQAPVVIFDFDGTLADSLSITVKVVNEILAQDGYPATVQETEFHEQHLTAILKAHNIPLYKLPFFHKRALPLIKSHMTSMNLVDGLREPLQELRNRGYHIAIVTSNAEENVQLFLDHHKLDMIAVIYAQASIFGKQAVLKKFLKDSGLTTEEVIYIGDETRDIEACHAANINVIGVSWGFNKRKLLEEAHPTRLIDHPNQLVNTIASYLKPPIV